MKCDNCHLETQHMHGAIIQGMYGQYCINCVTGQTRQASPGSASYSRKVDREAHEADIVQPWDKRGKANRDFARLYPDKAKEMFSKQELKEL